MKKYNEGILFQKSSFTIISLWGKIQDVGKNRMFLANCLLNYYNLLVSNNKNKKSERSEKAFIE
jgi:hypothetical protein